MSPANPKGTWRLEFYLYVPPAPTLTLRSGGLVLWGPLQDPRDSQHAHTLLYRQNGRPHLPWPTRCMLSRYPSTRTTRIRVPHTTGTRPRVRVAPLKYNRVYPLAPGSGYNSTRVQYHYTISKCLVVGRPILDVLPFTVFLFNTWEFLWSFGNMPFVFRGGGGVRVSASYVLGMPSCATAQQ